MRFKSLTARTLLKMSIRITVIMILMTALGYLHLMHAIDVQTQGNLDRYIREREAREGILFEQAQRNHQVIAEVFLMEYKALLKDPRLSRKYHSLVKPYADGPWRNADSNFDGTITSGIFIRSREKASPQQMAQVIAAAGISRRFGVAYRPNFQDTYFTFPSFNAIVLYWPDEPIWVFKAKDDLDIRNEEYAYVATPAKNSSRKIAWTGVFFDKVAKVWMLTGSTPIYDGEEFIGSVSHDVLVTELINRTLNDRIAGTRNYIVQADGRLIAHADHMEGIQKAAGQIDIKDTHDKKLINQFTLITNELRRHVIPDDHDNYLAIAEIPGPGWYLISEYPKKIIRNSALESVSFLLLAALISLIVELIALYIILKREVAGPLLGLAQKAQKISAGNYILPWKDSLGRTDEIGLLESSFAEMSMTIQKRNQSLARHAEELENTVEIRTRELAKQKEISVHASKLSALGEMAGGMAHEINTPLATMKLLISQASKEVNGDIPDLEQLGNTLVNIDRTVDRVGKIVKSLKTFARDGGQDPFELSNMETVFDDTINLCKERCKLHGIDLEISLPSEPVYVLCRPVQLCQVLLNLINNAHDAVMESDEEEKWIEVKLIELLDNIEIRVTDCGKGIPPALKDKIFNPFFTTKGVGKGTGMGLSISHGIIRAHQGDFFVDDLCSHTCFVLTLPKPVREVG